MRARPLVACSAFALLCLLAAPAAFAPAAVTASAIATAPAATAARLRRVAAFGRLRIGRFGRGGFLLREP